jgi:hypothetical protein
MKMSKAPAWRIRCALGFMTGAGALLIANAALAAETCDADGACPHGFVCTTFESPACATPDCAPDDDQCAKAPPQCEAHQTKECTPAECTENADCADGMVCYAQEQTTCSGGKAEPACAGDGGCKAETPESWTCETRHFAACVARYVPPCVQDSDCGAGFLCKEQLSVSCSGSASASRQGGTGGKGSDAPNAGPSDAGAPEPEPPTCTTEATGVFYCELQQMACDDASNCPSDFSCETVSEASVCSDGPIDAGPPSAEGSAGSAGDAGAPADEPRHETTACGEPAPAKKLCLPPYANYGYGTRADARSEAASSPTANGGSTLAAGKDGAAQVAPAHDGTAAADPAAKACSIASVGANRRGYLGLLALLPVAVVALRRRRSGRTARRAVIS